MDRKHRLRAARELAGLTQERLAERLKEAGYERLSTRTIRNLEDPTKSDPVRQQLEPIAHACGLPYEFFTIDFATLADTATRPREPRGAPAPGGRVGRRFPAGDPTPQDQPRPGSPPGEGHQSGSAV
jgi:transcriptional regulator with XRE-family HTH domain